MEKILIELNMETLFDKLISPEFFEKEKNAKIIELKIFNDSYETFFTHERTIKGENNG